jgi:hypothetical protein
VTPLYAIQFFPDDVASESTILDAIKTVRSAITIPNAKIIFVATGPQQTFSTIGTQANTLGVELKTIDQILGDIKYLALNLGESWGYLRLFPADVNDLRPIDIPVFDELPLDLSVVAGVITKAYQDINSHVNLKSKERNTPNMVLRDASNTHPSLAPWIDKPVHLVVTNAGFTLEATTPEVINAKLQEKLNKPWVELPVVDETRIMSFEDFFPSLNSNGFTLSERYGGKSVGLGFLANSSVLGRRDDYGSLSANFGYDLSARGLGIPVKFYRDFVNAPENATLKAKIETLVDAEKSGLLSNNERKAMVSEIQSLFYKGTVPPAILSEAASQIQGILPGIAKMKFRSSATS